MIDDSISPLSAVELGLQAGSAEGDQHNVVIIGDDGSIILAGMTRGMCFRHRTFL